MNKSQPMRLVRSETRETERQIKARADILVEHAKDKWTPIVTTRGGKALPTDQILKNSFRKTDEEKQPTKAQPKA